MLGGSLYCIIVGAVFLAAALFAIGTIFVLYVSDKWAKRNDPAAPGFLELDRRNPADVARSQTEPAPRPTSPPAPRSNAS